MIDLTNIKKTYSNAKDNAYTALKQISLSIDKKKFTCITGKSGSVKTTLLKIMAGLLEPDEGTVLMDNVNIYNLSKDKLAKHRNRTIGFVFQDFFLEENFTVYQNVELPLMLAGVQKQKRSEMIQQALSSVDLFHKMDNIVSNLSGGEKQRVSIARAIVNHPKVVFADEPCGNLDTKNSNIIMTLLREQVEEGKNVVLITHDLNDAQKADEIFTLADGEITKHEIL